MTQFAIPPADLRHAVLAQRGFAESLFTQLAEENRDPAGGITRDTYGPGEDRAHAALRAAGLASGLEVSQDLAGNSYVRWAAAQPGARQILMGSHLDSVQRGGNFDGAAGVLAGLVAIRALRSLGLSPRHDLVAMAIRAEESVWFSLSYIGSRAALGCLPAGALETARRYDTGRTLAEHMRDCGLDPDRLRHSEPALYPASIAAFLEVHIEQAPALLESGISLGICTGIPGNFRYPAARIVGRHDHVGTPRRFRRDAAVAGAQLAVAVDGLWRGYEVAGTAIAATFGRFHTDAAHHGLTTVPGLFHFSLDVRAYDATVLAKLEAEFLNLLPPIEAEYRVRIELGPRTGVEVGVVDPAIRAGLVTSAERQGISQMPLGSPASHDAAAFAAAGVPMGMIFLRNENGSHNPDEAMEIADFLDACCVLTDWLAITQCIES